MSEQEILQKITESVIDTDEGDAAELAQEALDLGVNVFTIVLPARQHKPN